MSLSQSFYTLIFVPHSYFKRKSSLQRCPLTKISKTRNKCNARKTKMKTKTNNDKVNGYGLSRAATDIFKCRIVSTFKDSSVRRLKFFPLLNLFIGNSIKLLRKRVYSHIRFSDTSSLVFVLS